MLTPARRIELLTGRLDLTMDSERWPLDSLCGFAARRNARRGFLIVSKVLGRHMPARPSEMRRSARDLAGLLPSDLPGPVLVVGLAETAVCLGHLVHGELREGTGRDDVFFIHSTRQRIDAPLLCRFEEPHSHAAAHLVYAPAVQGFSSPRSLVLVDDELSTGTTLSNLAKALVACWPGIETLVAASLTDWSGGSWTDGLPVPATSASLLTGTLRWHPRDEVATEPTEMAPAGALGRMRHHRNRGRFGLREAEVDVPDIGAVELGSDPFRIVGTGEFGYAPFLLAERLERDGRDIVVQSTSRSPIRLGGAIGHAHTFSDNYATDVPNYLYNAPPQDGRVNWICHETPPGSIDPELVAALRARTIAWPT